MLEINNYLKFLSSGELSGMDYENFVIETIEIEVSYIFWYIQAVRGSYIW